MSGHRFVAHALGYVGIIIVLCCVCYGVGLRVNLTDSIPRGVWLLSSSSVIRRGEVVSVCIKDNPVFDKALEAGMVPSGMCSNGALPFFKPVLAIAGDKVVIDDGVVINDVRMHNSARMAMPTLPVLARGEYIIPDGAVWLMSAYHAHSFDSRYFGWVDISHVHGVLEPLWLWQ